MCECVGGCGFRRMFLQAAVIRTIASMGRGEEGVKHICNPRRAN